MLSKKQFFKIFKTKYPFWAYSPRGILDISFAVKISENGGIGLIDTSSFSKIETKDLVMQIDQKLAKNQMWGVRIEDIEIISEIPHNIQIPILICAFNPQIEELKSLKQHAKFVVGEVNFLEEAQRTCQIFDFFLVKGNEAGGLVSSKSNFILIQEFHKAGYTFIIQGGFGIFNISSAFIGGACGVVFESQLYLLEESPINPSFKNYLTTIAENDFYLFGESEDYNYRLIGKLANKAIRETKKLEKSLLNQLNQIDEKNSVKIKKKFKEQLKLIYQTNSSFNHSNPKHSFLPTDHAICFASRIAEKYKNISNFFKGINDLLKTQIKSVKDNWPFKPNSEFTQLLKIKYPIIQGPMANVSDTIEFARKVAESGALPTFALGGLMGYEASALLKEATVDPIAEYSFAAGIIGLEVAKERRTQHLDAIKKYGPKITLIAAGSPDLGTQVKNQGQIVLFHAPSLSIFKLALKRNLDYLILEGKECGGHIGTLTSFILWENVLQYLDQIRNQLSEKINIVFAGGLLNHTSSAMLAAMLGNHLSLINPGIQMGTAYLFTPEIVSEKALSVEYQNQLLNNCKTCVIGTTVNTRARVIPTEFSNTIIRKENEWVANGVKIAKRKELYENNNLGALRIATKAEIWNNNHVEGTGTTQFISTSKKKQLSSGAFMAGDALCLRSSLVSIPKLHYDIIKKGEEFLNKNTLNETLSKIFLDNELKNKEILLKDQIESSSQANQELIENDDRIAIVGLGCIFPDANNIKEYWNNILNKKYSVSEIPKERWDIDIYYDPDKKAPAKSYTKIGAFVKNFKFKSIKYRIPPQIADHMDDVQKWALVAAEEALLDANYPVNGKNPLPIAVIIGNSLGGEIQRSTNKHVIFNEIAYYLSNNHKNHQEVEQNEKILQYLKEKLLTNIPEITEDTMPGELSNIISGRVSNAFNLTGKSMTTDAACASSLAAINTAINGLLMGDYDVVLAGGADRSMDPSTYIKFCKIGALSEDGSYPFDARANGFVMGEGVGFVVLKRVKDAIEANDKIYAIIRGIGSSSDGRGKGITAPNPSRQKLAIERALTASKLNFDQLQYVECHGTSTVIGDAAELKLLEEISQNTKVDRRIALGSVKSQIGHLKSAAAIASIIKTSLALYNKVLPPSINFKNPNPKVDWSKSAFYVNTETKAWESNLDELRRAGISAFGFGGTNYHAILEEYQPKISQSPQELTLASESLKEKSNLCFLFSGQGSQYLGMAKQLYHSIPEIKKVFDQANLICKEFGKFDLIEVIFGSESLTQKENQNRLTQTQFTQPAIYTVEISISEYLKKQGIVPNYLAGHSLGEYAALVNAGVLNFEDGLKAVILRGKAMANASSDVESSMAAIFSSQNEVSRILDQYSIENVNISNLNSMSQTVISGEKQSIKNAVKIFNSENITAKELNVSQGFHSKYVKHAEIEMEKYLDSINFSSPTIPVYSNVSGKIYPSDPKQIKNLLIQQITSPVRWVDEIKALYTDRARKFIEIGPKKALFYFAKDILKNKKEVSINYTLSPKKDEIKHLKEIVEQFTYNEHINKRRSEVKFSLREESKKQKPLIKQAYRKSKISKVSDIGSELLTSLSSSHNIIDKDSIPNLPYFSEFIQNQKEFVNDLIFSGYQQYINNVKPIVNQLNEYKKFGFNISRIGVTGVGLGLPGKSRNVFDENNIADILSGKNFIDLITIDEKQKFVSKHINQIHKSPSGDAKFVELDDISKVIHLAGQLGHYHPEKDYKIER
ncbi:MAG: beta-ketoacyl synthase N-terminal-like domain-containing protein [Candidatus Lokiarchaeota archaeon]